jgi:hypothetical protein
LLISGGFFVLTIYGLLRGALDVGEAHTAFAALMAFVALAVNVYLVLTVG